MQEGFSFIKFFQMNAIYPLELIKNKLTQIWCNDKYKEFCNHEYLTTHNLEKNSILFIGINPSLNPNDFGITAYPLKQIGNSHQYFKRFENIASTCSLPWTH